MTPERVPCPLCGKKVTLTMGALLRVHGHPARRCQGSGRLPSSLAAELERRGGDAS